MDLYCGVTYINVIILLTIFLPTVVFGQPQLNSSIGSLELSGEQCPGILMLTCDAESFGNSDIINWFVGEERVAVFDANENSTPFTGATTRPDLLNATVQLTSATITGSQSSFINFTLSTSVSNFFPVQGQNITCGNVLAKSSPFGIREFTIINESMLFQDPVKIEGRKIISGNEEMLMIQWNISDSQCEGTVYNFGVFLTYSTTFDNTTVYCSSICEVFFQLLLTANQYMVDIWAINREGQLVRKLSTTNIVADTSTINNSLSHTLQHSACEATLMCISAADGECVFEIIRNDMIEQRKRASVNSSVSFSNLLPNTLYFYHINITSLQPIPIIENQNFTTNKGSCGTSVPTAVIVGVVVPVVVVLVLILVVIIIVLVTNNGMTKINILSDKVHLEQRSVTEPHCIGEEYMEDFDERFCRSQMMTKNSGMTSISEVVNVTGTMKKDVESNQMIVCTERHINTNKLSNI